MDPFALIVLALVAGVVAALALLGLFHPRTPADMDRAPERRLQDELDDLEQLLEAKNERRRRRGEPEVTAAEYRAQIEGEGW